MASIIVRSARIALVQGNIVNLRVSVDRSLASAGGPAAGVVATAAVSAQGVSLVLPQITLYTTWDAPDQTTREAQYRAELVDSLGRVVTTLDSLNPFQIRIPNSQTTWKEITEWNEFYRASQNQTPPDAPGAYDSDPLLLPMNNIFLGLQSNAATDSFGLYVGNNDNPPGLRFNVATGVWEYSSNGTTWNSIGSGGGGGGTPAGPNNALQYNMGGVFGGSAAFTVDTTNGLLALNGAGINPGQLRVFGTNGNFWNFAANQPAANRTVYWPDPLPTTGQSLIAATVGATIALGWSKLITCTASQVLVGSGTDQATGSNNFLWAAGSLTTSANANTDAGVNAQNLSNGNAATVSYLAASNTISGQFGSTSSAFATVGLRRANQVFLTSNPGASQFLIETRDAATPIVLGIDGSELARLNPTGFGLGTNAPSTKLDINAAVDDSGLRLRGLGAATAAGTSSYYLGYDPTTGKVIRATTPAGGGGAPTTAQYILGAADGALPNGLVISATPGAGLVETVGAGSYALSFDQTNAFNPTIAGTYTWNRGNTPSDAITLDVNAPGTGLIRESSYLRWRARSNDGSAHTADIQARAGATSPDGQGFYWRLLGRIDAASYVELMRVSQGGVIAATNAVLTTSSAGSLPVGPNGATNPAFSVDVPNGGLVVGQNVTGTNNARVLTFQTQGMSFPIRQYVGLTDFGTGQVDNNWSIQFNEGGTSATHPRWGENIENFYVTGGGQRLIEKNWDYTSISGSVSYRPFNFNVDIDTHDAEMFWRLGTFRIASRSGSDYIFSVSTATLPNVGVLGRFSVNGQTSVFNNPLISVAGNPGTSSFAIFSPTAIASGSAGIALNLPTTSGFDYDTFVIQGVGNGGDLQLQQKNNGTGGSRVLVQGGSAGDAYIRTLAGQDWTFGTDRSDSGNWKVCNNASLLGNDVLVLTTGRNIGLNTSSFGTSAARVLSISSGTAPTTFPADVVQLVPLDSAAGDANLFAFNELGQRTRLTGNLAILDQDFTSNNATPANITGATANGALTRNLSAGARIKFRVHLFCTSVDATGGISVGIAGTATWTNLRYSIQIAQGTSYSITQNLTGLSSFVGVAGATAYDVIIEGSGLVNAAGTLTAAFSQNAANGTSTVARQSFIEIAQC